MMELYWSLGIVIFIFTYLLDPKVLRFDKDTHFRFARLILVSSAAAIVLNSLIGRFPPLPSLSFGTLLLVGWEDLVFSLLPIYYGRKVLHPHISAIVTIFVSIMFGLGHLYQGELWALLTCFYPFYFSYKLGKKHGYGTVMAIHVTYDVAVYTMVYVLGILRSANVV
jgi:hypothetical protein